MVVCWASREIKIAPRIPGLSCFLSDIWLFFFSVLHSVLWRWVIFFFCRTDSTTHVFCGHFKLNLLDKILFYTILLSIWVWAWIKRFNSCSSHTESSENANFSCRVYSDKCYAQKKEKFLFTFSTLCYFPALFLIGWKSFPPLEITYNRP